MRKNHFHKLLISVIFQFLALILVVNSNAEHILIGQNGSTCLGYKIDGSTFKTCSGKTLFIGLGDIHSSNLKCGEKNSTRFVVPKISRVPEKSYDKYLDDPEQPGQ